MTTGRPTGRSRRDRAQQTRLRLAEVHRLARTTARHNWPQRDPDHLAQRVTIAYWETFGHGGGPADLTGWLTRTMSRPEVEDRRRLSPTRDTRGYLPRPLKEEKVNLIMRQLITARAGRLPEELLHQIFGLLGRRDRTIVRLLFAGYSERTIAEQLDLRLTEVDQAQARAKRQLKLALEVDPGLFDELRAKLAVTDTKDGPRWSGRLASAARR